MQSVCFSLMLLGVQFAYRLDMTLDLYEFTLDDEVIVIDRDELDQVRAEIAGLEACWPELKPTQAWAALIHILGRDPRV